MKLGKKKSNLSKTGKKAKKQSMSFQDFTKSFQSLDNNNYGSWPGVVKVTILSLIAIVIFALTYFIPVKAKLEQIANAEAEQASLLEVYTEKESKARHLQEYKDQIAQMEVEFKTLLSKLPKETRVPELVKGINMTGVGSNIEFVQIAVQPEIAQELFIEQPIDIIAKGNYHQFGSFVSGIARLPRIITMHNFTVINKTEKFEVLPELELTINTKTYRSKALDETEGEDDETDEEGSE